MTEKEARAKGSKLKVGKVPMADETAGLMKTVVDATNERVLGATLLGVEGGEVVDTLYSFMLGNLPYTRLKGVVFIHPTLTEGLWFLMDDVKPVD